jgi:hypothetical protein
MNDGQVSSVSEGNIIGLGRQGSHQNITMDVHLSQNTGPMKCQGSSTYPVHGERLVTLSTAKVLGAEICLMGDG